MHLRFIYRQITSSTKQTGVFVACVALSLVTLVSLGGFGESVNNALLRDARVLLAGDIVARSGFPFEASLVEELERLNAEDGISVARTYEFITIVRTLDGSGTLLSEVKAVEPGYPFYGEVFLASQRTFDRVLESGQIVVAQNLLDRLGLQVGDRLEVGQATLTIADVVLSEPDQPIDFFSLGPRIFLHADDLEATGLIKPGSRINYRALLKVAEESSLESVAGRVSTAADARIVRVDTFRTNQSTVQIFFEDFLTFLSLIGIFTLLLAGIGIQSSLSAFIRERENTIAILRTFGATSRFIIIQFYAVASILGIAGTLLGLGLGIAFQWVFPFVFEPFLPPQVEFILSPRSIIEGMLLGVFVTTVFTFLPLYQLKGFKPRFIFRKEVGQNSPSRVYFFAQGLVLVFISAMTYRYLQNPERTAYFAVGIVCLVLIIASLSRGILFLIQRREIIRLDIRQAVRGLFRPRNATLGIIVTLSASLAVLFTIYLIERNLDATFVQAYPEEAPNVFLVDIQPDQREEVREVLGEETEFLPLVRARIRSINGEQVVPKDDGDGGRPGGPPDEPPELDDVFALTYRSSLADNERLTTGRTMFASDAGGLSQVSISDDLLEAYPFSIGDRIQFDIQGVPMEAQVSSIRHVERDDADFAPSFNFVLRERDLVDAPQTIVTTAKIPEDQIPQFQNDIVAEFPNITVINASAVIDTLAHLVADITLIVRFFTVFSIVAGILIIISSVLATRFARIQESVYYKVLGAKRSFVLRVFALENVFIGLVSAVLALFLSQLASWILITQVFELPYGAYWSSSFLLMIFTIALVTAVGLLASISILKKKPITFLREQTLE